MADTIEQLDTISDTDSEEMSDTDSENDKLVRYTFIKWRAARI